MSVADERQLIVVRWEIRRQHGTTFSAHLRERNFPYTLDGYNKALALYERLYMRGDLRRLRMMQPKPHRYGVSHNKRKG